MALPITSIEIDEFLAKYITEERDAFDEGFLKGDFFVPSPNRHQGGRLETSVIRYGTRSLEEMHCCGKNWANDLGEKYLGCAHLVKRNVLSIPDLDIIHTPRKKEHMHSDVVDWELNGVLQRVQAEAVARSADFKEV